MNPQRAIFTAQETEEIFHHIDGPPFWTPAFDQVQELESLLPEHLAAHPPVDDKGVINFNEYGRQYIGVTRNHRKLIYLNAFCQPHRFGQRWEKEPVLVKDGGSCYFQVYFDPAKKEFVDLHYNGQA